MELKIRNSANAVIVQVDKLLAIKKEDTEGVYFILPGGGQEHGENLHETLRRECIEEIGEELEVADLIFIREYIGKHHEHAAFDAKVHQIEYIFTCHLKEGNNTIQSGGTPDVGQIDVKWLPLSELLQYRLYPQAMRKYLMNHFSGNKCPVYLCDIN